jgi:hypothetical protein
MTRAPHYRPAIAGQAATARDVVNALSRPVIPDSDGGIEPKSRDTAAWACPVGEGSLRPAVRPQEARPAVPYSRPRRGVRLLLLCAVVAAILGVAAVTFLSS